MRKTFGVAVLFFAVAFLQGAAGGAALDGAAPRFALSNSHGLRRTLSDYKGKVVFINFWASWCAPCRVELPELNRLAGDYEGRKLRVLAVNVDRQRAEARRLLARLGLKRSHFEILWDSRSKAVSAYNIEGMPCSFVIDRRGVLRFTHVGFHDADPGKWRQEIDALLARK